MDHREATADLVAILTACNERLPTVADRLFSDLSDDRKAHVHAIACEWLLAAIADRGMRHDPPTTIAEFLRTVGAANLG